MEKPSGADAKIIKTRESGEPRPAWMRRWISFDKRTFYDKKMTAYKIRQML